MTNGNVSSNDELCNDSSHPEATYEQTDPRDYSRRDALRAIGRFSALVGATGVVVLSAEDAVAQAGPASCFRDCRQAFPPGVGRRQCYRLCRGQDLLNGKFNN